MGSVRLPNLSINSTYLYYKNILNSNYSFWYYYYFYFLFAKLINYIILDGMLINFSTKKFFNLNLKQNFFTKNELYFGSFHLYKTQTWFIINLFLFQKNIKNINLQKNSLSLINLKKLSLKTKMNYKFTIKK